MSEPYSVLVVDDVEANRDLLVRRVAREGYQVQAIGSGEDALALLRAGQDRFDLVLLDVMMLGMNGYEVLQQLRSDASLRHLPVIVVSAVTEQESAIRCIELGAEDYLHKPIDPVLLRARLRASLERKSMHDQERAYLARIEQEKRRSDDLLKTVIPMGIGLTAERNFDQLLEVVLIKAMELCNADGGVIYLRRMDDLIISVVRNPSLSIAEGGSSHKAVNVASLPLFDKVTGEQNDLNIVTFCALHNITVNIEDIYENFEFDFSDAKSFDATHSYLTRSMLAIPLESDRSVIGVLQLMNAQDSKTGEVIAFDHHISELSTSLALLAAAAVAASIRENELIQQIAELRIVVNEAKANQQVAELTDTEYFRTLKGRAGNLRQRSHNNKTKADV